MCGGCNEQGLREQMMRLVLRVSKLVMEVRLFAGGGVPVRALRVGPLPSGTCDGDLTQAVEALGREEVEHVSVSMFGHCDC